MSTKWNPRASSLFKLLKEGKTSFKWFLVFIIGLLTFNYCLAMKWDMAIWCGKVFLEWCSSIRVLIACCLRRDAILSQTSFSLYLYNQWTNFHKLSCAGKPQMRAIRICVGCTKVTTNDWDIRRSVAVKVLSANISWTAGQIYTIELLLESAHQTVFDDI